MRNALRIKDDVRLVSEGQKVVRHVPTGFNAIDSKFGGVRIGIATELMAHTGDGKTSFLSQLGEAGAKSGAGVLEFIAEDPEDATTERQLARDTGIDTMEIGRMDLNSQEVGRLIKAAEAATWAKHVEVVFGQVSVDEVLEAIDETTTIGNQPLQEVIIDYAQVLADSDNLEHEVARLGKSLQSRAATRGFAIVIGSQVSTDVYKRGREGWLKNRDINLTCPGIGDTEHCKRLEKYTKALWALFRPGRWMREFGEDTASDDYAELHVRKANFGKMGWAELSWDGSKCRFGDK